MPHTIAAALGVFATILFVASQAPMLIKAARTKDLASYSGTNLIVANFGNVAQAGYVITLPVGPVWALHAFNMVSSACMLFWWLRHRHNRTLPSTTGPLAHPAFTEARSRVGTSSATDGHVVRSKSGRTTVTDVPARAALFTGSAPGQRSPSVPAFGRVAA